MPNYDIHLKPGEKPGEEMVVMLKKHFSDKELTKLERYGGRIRISVTAPFTDRKAQKNIEISEELLHSLTSNPDEASNVLKDFTIKQLREVGKKLNLTIASAAKSKEIINIIVQYLKAPNQWKGIINS